MTKINPLDTWLAQEKSIRAVLDAGIGPGVARADQIAGKTGLVGADGTLYAHATTTCLVFELASQSAL